MVTSTSTTCRNVASLLVVRHCTLTCMSAPCRFTRYDPTDLATATAGSLSDTVKLETCGNLPTEMVVAPLIKSSVTVLSAFCTSCGLGSLFGEASRSGKGSLGLCSGAKGRMTRERYWPL